MKAVVAAALLASAALPAQAVSTDVYVVCNLDPNGDNFLTLREGPTSGSREVMRLPPGIRLEEWGRQGSWLEVDVWLNGQRSARGFVYAPYACLVEDH